jgi:hypothetical protein
MPVFPQMAGTKKTKNLIFRKYFNILEVYIIYAISEYHNAEIWLSG